MDQASNTKIDKSMNLENFKKDSYFEKEDSVALSEKELADMQSNFATSVKEYRVKLTWSMLKIKKFVLQGIEGEKPFSELSLLDKIFFITLDAPFDFLRRLTIPPGDPEQWNRRFAVACPVFSVLFIFYSTQNWNLASAPPVSFYVMEGIAVFLSILILFTTPLTNAPRRTMIIFSIVCFLVSILWIFFIANCLVDLMNLVGLIIGLDPSFLGITILASGLSMADLKVNAAVAKQGLAKMALTGCFAGPMFNLLIGLGSSITLKSIQGEDPTEFKFQDHDGLLPLIGIGTLLLQLIVIAAISSLSQFYLRRPQATIQIVYYLIVIIIITVASFTFAS